MSDTHKATLQNANALIIKGDIEGFLAFCTEDIILTTVGEGTLNGKVAVREWMASAYADPPVFSVETLVAESDYVTALGTIDSKSADGRRVQNRYCDVWRFRDGQMAELNAFVIEVG